MLLDEIMGFDEYFVSAFKVICLNQFIEFVPKFIYLGNDLHFCLGNRPLLFQLNEIACSRILRSLLSSPSAIHT